MTGFSHHPKLETLADFAGGKLDEARAVVVATHAAICGECAAVIAGFEAAGGALLNEEKPVAMSVDGLERVLARADASSVLIDAPRASSSPAPEDRLPLSAYLPEGLDDIDWRPVAPGLSQRVVEAHGYRPGVLRLLKIAPGTRMPKHSHEAGELTLILRGAYEDDVGAFAAGDLADLDNEHTHAPKAIGDEPCICLIATTGPLAFKTLIGRVAQPFIGL